MADEEIPLPPTVGGGPVPPRRAAGAIVWPARSVPLGGRGGATVRPVESLRPPLSEITVYGLLVLEAVRLEVTLEHAVSLVVEDLVGGRLEWEGGRLEEDLDLLLSEEAIPASAAALLTAVQVPSRETRPLFPLLVETVATARDTTVCPPLPPPGEGVPRLRDVGGAAILGIPARGASWRAVAIL